MKKFFLLLVCMIGIAPVAFAEGNAKVSVDGFGFEVTSEQKAEMTKSRWAHAFRLENTSSSNGDCCLVGKYKGSYYIASPDESQEYTVSKEGLTRVMASNDVELYLNSEVWAEPYDDFEGHSIKYAFGYDSNDNVFVVVYGR